MRIRRLNHSVYQVGYHLVWGTKYRRCFLKSYVRVELIKSFYQSQRSFPDWYFHSVNAGDDHVHLLTEIPPKYSVSQVVKILKAKASIDLKKKFPFIGKIYEDGNIWSVGYFVSTVGLNEEQIKKYIEKQNQYDMGFGVENEFS